MIRMDLQHQAMMGLADFRLAGAGSARAWRTPPPALMAPLAVRGSRLRLAPICPRRLRSATPAMKAVEIGFQHRNALMVLAAQFVEQHKQIGAGQIAQTPAAEPALLHLAVDGAAVMIEADRR